MHKGIYESLLTEKFTQQLARQADLHPEIDSVDEGEQPLTIARHLTRVIERSLRAARHRQDRADMARRILAALPDFRCAGEALHQDEPGKIKRLDEVGRRADSVSPGCLGLLRRYRTRHL